MTAAQVKNALESLREEVTSLIAAAEANQPVDATPLSVRAGSLTEAIGQMPGPEARTLLPLLEEVIGALDSLGATMRAKGAKLPDDQPAEPMPQRAAKAVSAYKTTGRY